MVQEHTHSKMIKDQEHIHSSKSGYLMMLHLTWCHNWLLLEDHAVVNHDDNDIIYDNE